MDTDIGKPPPPTVLTKEMVAAAIEILKNDQPRELYYLTHSWDEYDWLMRWAGPRVNGGWLVPPTEYIA